MLVLGIPIDFPPGIRVFRREQRLPLRHTPFELGWFRSGHEFDQGFQLVDWIRDASDCLKKEVAKRLLGRASIAGGISGCKK